MNEKSLISVKTLQTFLAEIKKIFAAKSHGTHVNDALSASNPLPNGTATPGVAEQIARADHVHPLQETLNGYKIKAVTQAEYNALTTVDPNTIYIIK